MNATSVPIALFRLGHIVGTPNALSQLSNQDVSTAIARHQAGDWGDLDATDRQANERALTNGTRLFSVHHSAAGLKFWVITEADRSTTTILMPEDY